jgi:hypothetical protein
MENSLHDPSKDWFLGTLNNMVNSNNITIGITIITHGYMISGHLAGGKQYFDAIGNEFSSLLNSGNVEDSLTGLADRIYNSESDNVKNGPLSSDYIHIRDAKFYKAEGSPISSDTVIWWRGRLSEVSGFSIGVVTGDKN